MRVEVFTFCWNELAILPWAVDYWRRYASRVTVFDNGSTDGSLEFMKQNSDLISVVDWGNVRDDIRLMDTKNQAWKEARGRADLVVVCDMDEMLIPGDWALDNMVWSGGTICAPICYNFMCEERPEYEGEHSPLHNYGRGELATGLSEFYSNPKAILFDPNQIEEINYEPGAHICHPTGKVRWYGGDIFCLHVNNGLSLEYRIERYKKQNERRSKHDVENGFSIHYAMSEEGLTKMWKEAWERTVALEGVMP